MVGKKLKFIFLIQFNHVDFTYLKDALDCYTKAVELERDDTKEKAVYLKNRAAVYLKVRVPSISRIEPPFTSRYVYCSPHVLTETPFYMYI